MTEHNFREGLVRKGGVNSTPSTKKPVFNPSKNTVNSQSESEEVEKIIVEFMIKSAALPSSLLCKGKD